MQRGDEDAWCEECRSGPPCFDTATTLGDYRGLMRDLVLRMKHRSGEGVTISLAELLWQQESAALKSLGCDVLLPVPMHWTRRLSRGTNNPDLVATCLARRLGIECSLNLVQRRRATRPQSLLRPAERLANVRGAFSLPRSAVLRDARVLLVDDILTTGATCGEIAGLLKRAGAASVDVAVLARADGGVA